MSGFYPSDQPPSPSSNHVPTQYYDRPPALPEQQSISSMHPARWFDLDSDNAKQTAKGLARVRRRPPPGSDHVKHRRTRSGCYTCRSRRVKVRYSPSLREVHSTDGSARSQCDEIHPTCKSLRPYPSCTLFIKLNFFSENRMREGLTRMCISGPLVWR